VFIARPVGDTMKECLGRKSRHKTAPPAMQKTNMARRRGPLWFEEPSC
jgi:hypothetical protein